MATAETARLIASLELQDKNFTRGLTKIDKGITRVDKKLGAFSGFVNRNMARAIDSIGVRLVSSVGQGLEEMATLEDAATSVTGAIGTVGKGWKLTADDIVTAANQIESATDAAFDDKAIVAASETLIRYGKVSEQNLIPAMEVMTDLAARTGDVDSAATLLAKALADPAKAAGKLARAGVVLTKEQQDQIKAMVKAGRTAEAQTFLLEQLGKTTKGAAAASAGPYRDALNKLGDAGEDLRRGFVTGLAPAILEVSELLTDELAKPATMETLKSVGKELGSALKGLIGVVKSLPWETIGQSLKLAGTGAKAVLDAFLSLPPWIQTAVLTGWGLNKLTGGGLSSLLGKGLGKGLDLFSGRGTSPANPLFVSGVGGGLGPGGVGGKGGGRFGRFGGAVGLIGGAVAVIGFEQALQLWNDTNATSTEQAQTASRNLNQMIGQGAKLGDLLTAQRAVEDGINSIQSNPLLTLVQGDALNELKAMRAKLEGEIKVQAQPIIDKQAPANFAANQASIGARENRATTPTDPKVTRSLDEQRAELGNIKNNLSTMKGLSQTQVGELRNVKTATTTLDATTRAAAVAQVATTVLQGTLAAGRDAINTAATRTGANQTAAATRGVSPPIVGALSAGFASLRATMWATRPVIPATTVVQNYTVSQRGGSTSDSRTRSGQ